MSDNYRSREERKQAQKAQKDGPQQEKIRKQGSFFRKFLITFLLLGIVAVGAGVSTFFTMIKDAPKLDKAKLTDSLSTKFYDKDGNFIHEYGVQKRTPITYEQIPKVVENAFLSTEDARFYEHHGVDIKRTVKAIFENVTRGFGAEGGSTITQQVVKNYYLTKDKHLKRKVQEWYLAYKLEQQFSKKEILEIYLNKIDLADSSFGIAAAAKNYYGIETADLNKITLPQAAMLAGLAQLPYSYNPKKPENVKDATKRRNLVLNYMYKQDKITKQQMDDALKVPVTEGLLPPAQNKMPYQSFLDAVAKEVESKIKDVNIGKDGLAIYTTLDPKAQDYADKLLDTNEFIKYPNDQVQAAFVFQDTKTGEVRALGSGRNQQKGTFRGVNFALDGYRQPGSTFKPIFDYGPAVENLKWATSHMIEDKETFYNDGKPIRNWDNKYLGWMTIRDALKNSRNVPALATMREVGIDKSKAFAENLGIKFTTTPYESTSIGASLVTPIEMAGAYGSFANNGVYIKPHFVTKVVFPDGKEVDFKQKEKRVMNDYTSYILTDMMRSVVESGTGTMANVPNLDIAGKTGTTNFDEADIARYDLPKGATYDSWFVGYSPQYTMSVWTGYDKKGKTFYLRDSDGSTKIPMLLFKKMMSTFGTDTSAFEQPSSVYRSGGELGITSGGEKPTAPKEKPDAPSIQAKYDQASNSIILNWTGDASPQMKDATYEVSYTLDNGAKTSLSTTKNKTITLTNIKPGGRYTFFVTAAVNDKVSDAASISVTVPGIEKPTPPNNGTGTGTGTTPPPNPDTPPPTTPPTTPGGEKKPPKPPKPPGQNPLNIP